MLISMEELIPILQVAVGPVVVISGVGLVLLTLTNRLGRVIDRSRLLTAELRQAPPAEREHIEAQIAILIERGTRLRRSITWALLCALFAALLVIALFVGSLARAGVAWLVSTFFVLSMVSLILSLLDFILDIHQALGALKIELSQAGARDR